MKLIIYILPIFILFSCNDSDSYGIMYYENGQIKNKYSIKNNIRHGKSFSYYESGELMSTGNWNNGHADGQYILYHKNGNIHNILWYDNGVRQGNYVVLDSLGNIDSTGEYFEDRILGWGCEYHNGKLNRTHYYLPFNNDSTILSNGRISFAGSGYINKNASSFVVIDSEKGSYLKRNELNTLHFNIQSYYDVESLNVFIGDYDYRFNLDSLGTRTEYNYEGNSFDYEVCYKEKGEQVLRGAINMFGEKDTSFICFEKYFIVE